MTRQWRNWRNAKLLRARPSNGPRYKLGAPTMADWNDAYFTSAQLAGDVLVLRGEIVVGGAPWHTHWALEQTSEGPELHLIDTLKGTEVAVYRPGTWDTIRHES